MLFSFSQTTLAQVDLTNTPAVEENPARPDELVNKAVINIEHSTFDQGFDPWDQGYISYGRRFDFGSVIARYNRAYRFGLEGEQWELDAYPRIRDGTYMYLNYGRSNSAIFPNERYGAEIFQSLPASFEISLGFRKLHFTSGGVTLMTGSITKYISDYMFYFRAYHTPSDIGASNSWTLGGRYYLDDEQYFAAAIGQGLSIEQDFNLAVIGLQSSKANVDAYLSIGQDYYVHPGLGYRKDEIRSGVFRQMWTADFSLEKRF